MACEVLFVTGASSVPTSIGADADHKHTSDSQSRSGHPLYVVGLAMQNEARVSDSTGSRTYIMRSGGQKFQCTIPDASAFGDAEEPPREKVPMEEQIQNLEAEACIEKAAGWWTYEVADLEACFRF